MNTRKLLWKDRRFCEQWDWNGLLVQRHRVLVSYPWKYQAASGVDSRHYLKEARPLTHEEIQGFKQAQVA